MSRADGKTTDAFQALGFGETLTAAQQVSIRGRIGSSDRNLIAKNGVARSAKTLSDSFDLPVMAVPPTITRTLTNAPTLAAFTYYSGGTSAAFHFGPIATSRPSGYTRPLGSASLELSSHFYCDADILEIALSGAATSLVILCNGELIQAAGITENAGAVMYKLAFADARPRLFEVKGQNLMFGGVYTNGLSGKYSCWAATDIVKKPLIAFFGDSYTVGVGSSFGLSYHNTIGRALACRTWGEGIGSMGWNSANPNDVLSRVNNRMAQLLEMPDMIVAPFGFNDAGGNMTNLQSNIAIWATAVKSRFPGVPILLLGPWTPVGITANLTLVQNAMETAATANSIGYRTLEGIVTAGNKDLWTGGDNTHPNGAAGANYLGVRLAPIIANSGLWLA